MLIVCPACASEYEIPVERVGASGRQVRCAACREMWFITPEAVAESMALAIVTDPPEDGIAFPALPPGQGDGPIIDQPSPYPQQKALPAPSQPRSGKKAKKRPGHIRLAALRPSGALLAAGLALFVVGPLALLGRSTVVRAMPQTATLYARIGLPVNLRGIDIRDVVAFQNPAQGDKPPELVVEGDLIGVGQDRAVVPDLAVEVQDEHGQTLYRWSVPAPRQALEPKETARFHASLSAPPAAGRGIALRFAAASRSDAAPVSRDAVESVAH